MDNTEDTGLAAQSAENEDKKGKMASTESRQPNAALEMEILEYIANSSAMFKSQQKEDPELSFEEKRSIAGDLLGKSQSLFLARFGEHMKKEHLNYFINIEEDYQVRYHIERLKRYLDDTLRQIDVKNRRYQALKMMVEQGEYFSESEMMKRNPLLYHRLIGQYLSEEEKKKRDNINTTDITFVNLLLESIERDRQRSVKKAQEEAEEQVEEENDSDEDSDDTPEKKLTTMSCENHWGEMSSTNDNDDYRREKERSSQQVHRKIPTKERQLLREEFVTYMYESFLNGKDTEFDYSTVDDNEAYDNVVIQSQDEEDKYFDSESPETVFVEDVQEQNNSEDELDVYMKSLKVK